MNANSRFTVALHILTLLAFKQKELTTSAYIARSVTTNPVVIRRIMGELRRAGLVRSQAGNSGGWELLRSPERISMLDAYRAVAEGPLFPLHPQPPNPTCCIGKTIQCALTGFFAEAEAAMQQELSHVTIADVLARVQSPSNAAS